MGKLLLNASYNWSEDSVRLIVSPSPDVRKSYFYVQETGYFKTSPPYFTERRNLNSFLIVYTLSGKGNLQYKGKNYVLDSNSLFFIDCMQYQHYKSAENSDWEFLWLHFNGHAGRKYYDSFAESSAAAIPISNHNSIKALLWQIIDLHKSKNKNAELLCSLHITRILTELLILYVRDAQISLHQPEFIIRLYEYIDSHFNESISLDMLAYMFSLDKFHMIKEFKKYAGITLNEYIIKTRINKAKELLKYSNLPVSQIAELMGTQNVSHFINLFKAREHMTPLAFRKQWS